MEVTLAEIIIGSVGVLVSSSFLTTLVIRFLDRRKDRISLVANEAVGMEDLLDRVKKLVNERINDAAKLQELAVERNALASVIKGRDSQILEQTQMLKNILVEQGAAMEREKQCKETLEMVRKELDALKGRMAELENLHILNKRLEQDKLRLQGEVESLKKWFNNEAD